MGKILKVIPPQLSGLENIVGVDEVGRGCFAGPVVVSGVILPKNFKSSLIRDSKKLSEKKREEAYQVIIENATAWDVQAVQATDINKIGIEKALYQATKSVLNNLYKQIKFDHIIADGNRFDNPMKSIPYTTMVKGDDVYAPIAAASILAKVRRDDYMIRVHKIHPKYNFDRNKGYFCKKHGKALIKYGKCRYHRDKYVNTWLNKQQCNVVHLQKDGFDVNIGRPSKWGNPFSHKPNTKAKYLCETREEAIEKYEEWITNGDGKYLLDDLL